MEGIEGYLVTYGAYLEDIRRRVYRLAVSFAVSFTAGLFLATPAVRWLIGFFSLEHATIVMTSPFQLLDVAVTAGFMTASLVTVPLLLSETYRFLRSGLLAHERRLFTALVPLIIFLFVIGFAYGFAVMYYALDIIASVNATLGIVNLWDVTHFVSLILGTATLLGLLFEFPLVLTVFIRRGVLTTAFLVANRRMAYAVILVLVIFLPPTDGLSAIIMAAPLVLIYELTILINSRSRGHALST